MKHAWGVVLLSVLVAIPCWWQRRIEAGDLASHVYNAWLARLIHEGKAPGLYIESRWTNVLFDWLLSHAANWLGFAAGEKAVVSIFVLVFFWGAFSLAGAISNRPPWFLAPLLAMLAYGYSFQMGFLNYYGSVGLACFALALIWKGGGSDWIAVAALAVLAVLAHPIGAALLAGAGLFLVLWKWLRGAQRIVLPVVGACVWIVVHYFLVWHPAYQADWNSRPAFYVQNGADQFLLYGARYAWIGWGVLLLAAACVAVELATSRQMRAIFERMALPAALYVVAFLGTALLPENLRSPMYGAWIGLLVSRVTLITAVFGLCLLACAGRKSCYLAGGSILAAVFFVFLYRDTSRLNAMERQAEALVAQLPAGSRVVESIRARPGSRLEFIGHMVDRACIGHCFSYGNYEPASGQFRIRVSEEGSPLATGSAEAAEAMAKGTYMVQPGDLPLYQIEQCNRADADKLCIRALMAGERNGRAGGR